MRRLLLPLSLATFVLACNGGSADLTDREISDGELVAMMLPQADLGPAYAELELDDESGFQSNEDVVKDANDKEDEAEDIERYRRVTGYQEAFTSLEALSNWEGVFGIGTFVNLYEDADGASGDLLDNVDDAKRAVGTTAYHVTLKDVEEFTLDGIGDESARLIVTLSVTDDAYQSFYGTVVMFRRGRLIGAVLIVRGDEEDVREEVTELAHKLDERILAVLRGEIEPRATPTPKLTGEPAPTPDRTGAAGMAPSAFLRAFALALT